ncbi:MAG: GAF domain-containing protein [Bacteroidota bacterium]
MMKKITTWYKNTKISTRVIISMNMAILAAIVFISVFAAINRVNVQKNDARALVENELDQVTNLMSFLQDRPLEDLSEIIRQRVLYNTGFISVVSQDGEVLISREREGRNIAGETYFRKMGEARRGEVVYNDPVTGNVMYQYHTFHEGLGVYVTATLEKKEFIDKTVYNTLTILLFALIFTWITFSLTNYFIMKTVTVPINGLVGVIRKLGKGNLTEPFYYPYKDEVGQMAGSVNELLEGLKRTAIFASEIGKNNFDHPYEPLSDQDVLGNALLDMRKSLKAANEEEKIRKAEDEKRNWTTQGLARFADILRQNNNDIQELSYHIIRNLVDYLEVNQGGVFIINEENPEEKFLEMTACYAFDRRKYLQKKILPGEGLVGTCFLEKETIYITQIPQDYIRITSGLGDDNPASLLIIPLKINENIYGVIELASFTAFEKYKLEFVEKIGESIASTISSVKINSNTAQLLEKSQQQAEEMRAQEEEMRQNMEELAATQEAMAEKERSNVQTIEELEREKESLKNTQLQKEIEFSDVLERCPVAVVRCDRGGAIILFNLAASQLWRYAPGEVVGSNLHALLDETSAKETESLMQELAANDGTVAHREVFIRLKDSKIAKIPALMTLTVSRASDGTYYTLYFNATGNARDEQPNAPIDIHKEKFSGVEESSASDEVEKEEQQAVNSGNSSITSELNSAAESDTQKAWTEHIAKKGKEFKKTRKKN